MPTSFSKHTKSKKCDFTFALSDFEQIARLKSEIYDFDIWGYIDHKPDDEDGHDHTHFFIHLKQPVTISNLAEKLDIPDHMIEWVRNKTKFIQYMIHKNNPEKIQYEPKDIISNDTDYFNQFINSNPDTNLFEEYDSLRDVYSGRITAYKYIDTHSRNLKSLPFYSRQCYLIRLIDLARKGESNRFNTYSKG